MFAQRIIFPGKGEVALEEYDPGVPNKNELLVRTLLSQMSIGTESTVLHQRYDDNSHFGQMFSYPQRQTGVQAVGIIEGKGSGVTGFELGQRVFMRMAHRSHVVLAAADCTLIPDSVDSYQACWTGLAKTAFRAAWASPFRLGGHAVIVGAGPVGQMLIRWAVAAGLQEIVVVDPATHRLQLAEAGGASWTIPLSLSEASEPLARANSGRGPSLVVDTTGNAAVFEQAQGVLAQYGKLLLLGDTGFPGNQALSSNVMTKGLSVEATHDSHNRDGWSQQRVDTLFYSLVTRGKFDVSGLQTHEFAPDQCVQAYELVEKSRSSVMGLTFRWGYE